MTKPSLVLSRHGTSSANEKRILEGLKDSPLSAIGRRQAYCMAQWARSRDVSLIYSSTARRARDTAAIIADHLGVSVVALDALLERDFGPFEGLDRERLLEARLSRGLTTLDPTQDWCGVAEVESDEEIWVRISPVIDEILKSGKTGLIVTHAGVIKAALHSLFQIPSDRALCFKIPNGSLIAFRSISNYLELLEFCPDPCDLNIK